VFALWIADIRASKPHLVIHEITERHPEHVLQEQLGDLYDIHSFILDPTLFGFPNKRPRRYTIMVLLASHIFTGSHEELVEILGQNLLLTGDDVFLAPPEVVMEYEVAKAKQRGFVMSTNEDEEPQLPTLAHMLTPCEQDRFEDHANLRSSLQGLGGEYIVDLDQNPPFSHGSSLVPTLVTQVVLLCPRRVDGACKPFCCDGTSDLPRVGRRTL